LRSCSGRLRRRRRPERPLSFSDEAWELDGEPTSLSKEGGRDVLQIETGFAHRRASRFENGRLDFDVQVTS
jgi:hypothetical protein